MGKKALEMFKTMQADPALVRGVVGYQTYSGHTTLMNACCQKNVDLVKELIAAGADVNAMSEEGERVLNWAILRGGRETKSLDDPEEQIVKILVEAGATLGRGYGCYPERLRPYQKGESCSRCGPRA